MIYRQIGLNTSKLKLIKHSFNTPLEALANTPLDVVSENEDLEKYKSDKSFQFLSGDVKPNEDGSYTRNNNNLNSRDLIIIDIEKTGLTSQEVQTIIQEKLVKYKYYLYFTISHEPNNPRLRLVLEPNREIVKDEYEPTIQNVMALVGVNYDTKSYEWSQPQGLPIAVKGKETVSIKHLEGELYPVQEAVIEEKKVITTYSNEAIKQIPHDQAISIMEKYVENEKENLQERNNNYLSCLTVIAKSVVSGEIEYDTAIECMEMLALGNEEWKENNLKEFNGEITRADGSIEYFKNNYTFIGKFLKTQKVHIKTTEELYAVLEKEGNLWREERTTVNKNTGKVNTPVIPFYVISNILYKYVPIKLGGYDKQSAILYLYDYSEGIYVSDDIYIKTCIRHLDFKYKLSKGNLEAVAENLKTRVKFENTHRDPNKIAVGNGIFNCITKKLEPFNPKHFITAKIDTAYNHNAVEEYNQIKDDYFNFDEWLEALACGDSEIVTLFWQMFNEAINPNKTRRKFVVLLGDGKNGKSTVKTFLTNLIGRNNMASLSPQALQERFGLGGLEGKICNYPDEIGTKPLDEMDKLKSIVSGEIVSYEKKNKDVRYYDFKTLLIFNSNKIPPIKEKTKAVTDRILIIPLKANFEGKLDPSIKDEKLHNKIILEYALYKILHLSFDKFIEPKVVKKEIEKYNLDNDSVYNYMIYYTDRNLHHISAIPVNYVTADYHNYCTENGIKPISYVSSVLSEKLNEHFGSINFEYVVKLKKYTVNNLDELRRNNLFKDFNSYNIERPQKDIGKQSIVQEVKESKRK